VAQNKITVALAGNPKSGKTTVFNNLTGAHQYVGNWPGVTIEKKEGQHIYQGHCIRVVDLPGVYSLTAYAPDEVIARNFIVDQKPDAVVDIVDASNLERNLYLTVQILEMGVPLIIALNMMDMAQARGHHINIKALSQETGAPVVPMVASRNQGTEALLAEIVRTVKRENNTRPFKLYYGQEIENEISNLEKVVAGSTLAQNYPPRWLSIKLLEEDEEVTKNFREAGVV
jgi:ferrous iron transport protein B